MPYILLAVVVAVWSIGWVYIRHRVAGEMDGWLAGEAAAGRSWTCADRSITGYPFRIELRCASLAFGRSDSRFTLGPVTAVAQVYQPRRGILEVGGPFHVEQGDLTADANWNALKGSFHGASDGFVRASLVVDGAKGSVHGAGPGPIDFDTGHLEVHARPTPGRFASEGAVDTSLRVSRIRLPLADAALGNADPADLALDATVSRATILGTGTVAQELDAWRAAGGSLDLTDLSLAKGERRLRAKGRIDLDAAHRPQGQLDLRAAGLEALVGQVMGQRFGAEKGALIGNLVGQLLGRRNGPEAGAAGKPDETLKALPPLRLAEGRVMLGPFPIPNVQLPPLY